MIVARHGESDMVAVMTESAQRPPHDSESRSKDARLPHAVEADLAVYELECTS